MKLFFPFAHAQIDWPRGFEFLDKELQKITADAAVGRRVVDKLVKVWLKTGQELCVLIHIEVQGTHETGFELRLYVYNFRIYDRFKAQVATFVILTDEDKNWRPNINRTTGNQERSTARQRRNCSAAIASAFRRFRRGCASPHQRPVIGTA
ncbi:MAG: hypothetical protein ACRD9Y_24200 [Blastocatellia bacterium]